MCKAGEAADDDKTRHDALCMSGN